MPYLSGQDITQDALFRAGEIPGSSEWDSKVLDYLNRNYLLLCAGASEYLTSDVPDWWWLRGTGVLTVLPTFKTGSISVTRGSASISITPAPSIALLGYRIRFDNFPDVYKITSHGAGSTSATIDSPFNGNTNSASGFTAMKTTYSLDTNVSAILSPVVSFRENPQIMGIQPERMDTLFPLGRLNPGVSQAFCLEDEQTIRFSHGGLDDGVTSMRMEYRYRPVVTPLMNSPTSYPLVPVQYRPLLTEMTLVQLYSDKNDDRIAISAAAAKAGIAAMVLENKRRLTKMDATMGAIITRPGYTSAALSRALRTESGLIIG